MPKRVGSVKGRTEVVELIKAREAGKLSAEGHSALDALLAARAADGEGEAKPAPADPGAAAGAGEKPTAPSSRPEEKPPVVIGEEIDEDCCCDKIIVLLEEVKIVRLTGSQLLNDDIVVTAHSFGKVMAVSPQPFAYPVIDGKIKSESHDVGGGISPNVPIAVVESGRDCRVELDCQISFWEEDAEELDALVNETTQALVAQLSASATGVSVPTPGLSLIAGILRLITQKLGLSNDRMGTLGFGINGKMACKTPLKDMQWVPPLAHSNTFQHEALSDDLVRLKKTLRHDGGIWDVSILVQRICTR